MLQKPIRIDNVEEFKEKNEIHETVDQYPHLLRELFLIRNPGKRTVEECPEDFGKFTAEQLGGKSADESGQWFYFSWNKTLVHYLPEALHQEIRTARNRDIITDAEQQKLYDATVAVAGLSVGSHGAFTIAMMGMGRHIKLADPDEISASNLNRLQYDFTKLGKNKAETAAEKIYLMNPYATVDVFPAGVTAENLDEFLSGVDILIEEMDSLPMKVAIRQKARELGVPVLMATDNGNSVIMDVERFDMDRKLPLFHGRIASPEKIVSPDARKNDPKLWHRVSSEIIGIEFMEEDLILSLQKIGRTIGGVPQLGAAAVMSGALLAIIAARIVTGKPLASGKYIFSTEAILTPDYQGSSATQKREAVRAEFKKFLSA